jgi:hypothetical protein
MNKQGFLSFDRCQSRLSQQRDIFDRRLSEVALVVSAEVGWIVVSYSETGAGGVEALAEH